MNIHRKTDRKQKQDKTRWTKASVNLDSHRIIFRIYVTISHFEDTLLRY